MEDIRVKDIVWGIAEGNFIENYVDLSFLSVMVTILLEAERLSNEATAVIRQVSERDFLKDRLLGAVFIVFSGGVGILVLKVSSGVRLVPLENVLFCPAVVKRSKTAGSEEGMAKNIVFLRGEGRKRVSRRNF